MQKLNITGYDKIFDSLADHLGTAMYIRRGLQWTQVRLLPEYDQHREIEGCSIKLETKDGPLTINGIYLRGNSQRQTRLQLESLWENGNGLYIGDHNIRSTRLGQTRTDTTGRMLETYHENGLIEIWHTNLPSRPNHAGQGILDIAIATGPTMQYRANAKQIESIGSDHMPWLLTIELEHELQLPVGRNLKAFLSNADSINRYKREIEQHLQYLHEIGTVIDTNDRCEIAILNTENAIIRALDIVAPFEPIDHKNALTPELREALETRNRLKRIAARTRTFSARYEYNQAKNLFARMLYEWRDEKWRKIINSTENQRERMWRVQKSLKKPPQRLPMIPGCQSERDTINALVNAAIVQDVNVDAENKDTMKTTPFQPIEEINMLNIKKAVFSFKNRKAPGPDGIQGYALKYAGPVLWKRLADVVNYILHTGYFPTRWKTGECIFLHKNGKDYRQPTSYRPITLLNTMSKVCERVLYDKILKSTFEVIPDFQHGFVRGKGTATQILRTGKYICDHLAARRHVSMIATDLTKAFDSIHHEGLTKKLVDSNIDARFIKLIENYLDKRRTRGRFRTTTGDDIHVPHGVPQGSILGPLIFNLYVHDLPKTDIAGQIMSQYADDLCVLNVGTTPDFATIKSEWAANVIMTYYHKWGLKCNVDKTECIMFSKRRPQTDRHQKGYKPFVKIKDTQIHYKKEVKYLGVWLDRNLSMNKHVAYVRKKAQMVRGMLGPIIGWFSKVDVEVKKLVIQACLLPVLDYGVVQLLPRISKSNILSLERQYRMALKTASNLPRCLPTEIIWEMLDEDPWHLRIHDLHVDMLLKLETCRYGGLEVAGEAYNIPGQFNPMKKTKRYGDIEHIPPAERKKQVSKRLVPNRELAM